ncbi:hypothetical protein Tcan_11593 [Toxocara canis]|uniref:Uncharacterized protein n=1 Tax=Toxocara canis TaxID=6265 RepID=A0A0B2VYW5_TOXCA|nr:hypothetical protein Tcan_11593 [Toxocara canis]
MLTDDNCGKDDNNEVIYRHHSIHHIAIPESDHKDLLTALNGKKVPAAIRKFSRIYSLTQSANPTYITDQNLHLGHFGYNTAAESKTSNDYESGRTKSTLRRNRQGLKVCDMRQTGSITSTILESQYEASMSTNAYSSTIKTNSLNYVGDATANLYILLGVFAALFVLCVIFFVFVLVRNKIHKYRSAHTVCVLDLPPRYSEVMPPPYEWVIAHMKADKKRLMELQIETLNDLPSLC